jgi:hypothetical protein
MRGRLSLQCAPVGAVDCRAQDRAETTSRPRPRPAQRPSGTQARRRGRPIAGSVSEGRQQERGAGYHRAPSRGQLLPSSASLSNQFRRPSSAAQRKVVERAVFQIDLTVPFCVDPGRALADRVSHKAPSRISFLRPGALNITEPRTDSYKARASILRPRVIMNGSLSHAISPVRLNNPAACNR